MMHQSMLMKDSSWIALPGYVVSRKVVDSAGLNQNYCSYVSTGITGNI